ncbi:MAG: AI-2E family transporter [Planctomycetota bacterium]|nr:MAG: AI-2E family transporter [Planctomycetota bacterium]
MRPARLARLEHPRIARRRRLLRWGVALGLVAVLCLLGVFLSDVFNPLLLGLLLAYILDPLVGGLERRGVPRGLAVGLLFGIVLLGSGGLLTFASLRAATRLTDLKDRLAGERVLDPADPDDQLLLAALRDPTLRRDLPLAQRAQIAAISSAEGVVFVDADRDGRRKRGLAEQASLALRDRLGQRFDLGALGLDPAALARAYEEHASEIVNVGIGLSQGLRRSFSQLGTFFSYLLLVPVYTFFLSLSFADLRASVRDHLPGFYRERIVAIAAQIDAQVAAFFRGKLAVVLVKGAATWLGLWLAGVPFSFFIGMGAGLLSIVPLVGPIVGGVLSAVLCYTPEGWLLSLLWVALAFGFAEVVEAVVSPWILGEAVGLSPLALILSLFVFGKLFGFFGVLLAVPIACVVKTLFLELVLPHLEALAREGAGAGVDAGSASGEGPAIPRFGSRSSE